MSDFIIPFLICNFFISIIIGILLFLKWKFKNFLSSRMQYSLWFVLLILLIIPFLPFQLNGLLETFINLKNLLYINPNNILSDSVSYSQNSTASNWMNDFSISVSSNTPSGLSMLLFLVWILGTAIMLACFFHARYHLYQIRHSALPLENSEIQKIYQLCLNELKLHRSLPVYSTAFLKSPALIGFFRPGIYLPLRLISTYNDSDLRYILLHELQHYKHKDELINHLVNLIRIPYWFNPFVRYALNKMRNDREVACDSSVLRILDKSEYLSYGNTLVNYAEKNASAIYTFTSSIGSTRKQLEQRINNIVSYEVFSRSKQIRGILIFFVITFLIAETAPILSTSAAENNFYQWNSSAANVSLQDFSSYFGNFEGSFVLYDALKNQWTIYNPTQAVTRCSPNSTYKIYDALFGLESGIITPEDSSLTWDQQIYPFDEWNNDQTLSSAMQYSVNWYFQSIDKQLGKTKIQKYIKKLQYGNQNVNDNISSYWLESSLKISPIEQVELLDQLYHNEFQFSNQNIDTVKDILHLSDSSFGSLFGKTGTGRVNNHDINGWFVGYIENSDNVYFFATNLQAEDSATGSTAAETTLSILSDLDIWIK